jgi:hypothetical protein
MCYHNIDESHKYNRTTANGLKGKFLFYLFHFGLIVKKLWFVENFIETSIIRGETITFNKDGDGKIMIYQSDGEKLINMDIDKEYIDKITKGDK